MPTDTPPFDESIHPYTERDIDRTITMLKTDAPAMIERIELEKDADETIAKWIRDAIRAGDPAPDHYDSAENEIGWLVSQRFFAINRDLERSIAVPIEIPREIWQRARLEIKHQLQQADEPLDIDDAPVDNALLEFIQPDYKWSVNGVPLAEVDLDADCDELSR